MFDRLSSGQEDQAMVGTAATRDSRADAMADVLADELVDVMNVDVGALSEDELTDHIVVIEQLRARMDGQLSVALARLENSRVRGRRGRHGEELAEVPRAHDRPASGRSTQGGSPAPTVRHHPSGPARRADHLRSGASPARPMHTHDRVGVRRRSVDLDRSRPLRAHRRPAPCARRLGRLRRSERSRAGRFRNRLAAPRTRGSTVDTPPG